MKAKDPSQTPEKKTKVDDEKLIILCSGWEGCERKLKFEYDGVKWKV
jgi:hypothetical protein